MSRYYDNRGITWSSFFLFTFPVIFLLCIVFFISAFFKDYRFERECAGYLNLAANANDPKLVIKYMDIAIEYIERNNLDKGNTTVIFNYPDRSLDYWYANLKEIQADVKALPDDVSQLERSNVLMKVRESLTDSDSQGGSRIILPPYIAYYPSQFFWSTMSWICGIMSIVSVCGFGVTLMIHFD